MHREPKLEPNPYMATTKKPKRKSVPQKVMAKRPPAKRLPPKRAIPTKTTPTTTVSKIAFVVPSDAEAEGTPAIQPVFIRVSKNGDEFTLQLFFDSEGEVEMTNDTPLNLLQEGKIRFNFVKSAGVAQPITADLVIIAQTVADSTVGSRRASPFKHNGVASADFYPVYYLPSPAGDLDPLNLTCSLECGNDGVIVGGTLDVIRLPDEQKSPPYKYTIVALCEGATKVANIDPTVIIHPN